MKLLRETALALILAGGVGCGLDTPEEVEVEALTEKRGELSSQATHRLGELLFRRATFRGNGRTCETCHSMTTGTFSPEEAQARYQADPEDPLFRALDSDDGTGQSYDRLLNDATIAVSIPLPPNVKLASDPSATHVTLRRGVPSTLDTPALEPVLMADGREPDLATQAHSAIMGHAEAQRMPSPFQTQLIASFEQTLFSSPALREYANGGPEPVLPEGTTDSEKRGRAFFAPDKHCGACHAGPLLNEVPPGNMLNLPPGIRFARALVSELNPGQRPVHEFIVTNPDGTTRLVRSPDPGRFLVTGDLAALNTFKIGILWNVRNTAPYFHDNSAPTLEAVMTHYERFFQLVKQPLTEQDKEDITAFLKRL